MSDSISLEEFFNSLASVPDGVKKNIRVKVFSDSDDPVVVSIPGVEGAKGSQKHLFVSDIDKLFSEILTELKINNAQLEIITGEKITEDDLEEGE